MYKSNGTEMDTTEEEIEIVIVGGGIAGLATALALHRKGVRSVVLERSEILRSTGAAIGILTNGWRALDELGIGDELRHTALHIPGEREILLENGRERKLPLAVGEARCVKRIDLVKALALNLPPNTIRFGIQVVSIKQYPYTSFPILRLDNGTSIKAKILIGCEGSKSIVADFIDLKPPKVFSLSAVRGITNYEKGHGFVAEFYRLREGDVSIGRFPITEKLVYWYISLKGYPEDPRAAKEPELIKQVSLAALKNFPTEVKEMVKTCDLESLSLTHLRHRSPWDLLLEKFRKGTVTVAGDAMHVMGPFLGQGGSTGIEDAIVLTRCLVKKMDESDFEGNNEKMFVTKVGEALDHYVKERRMRLVWLALQTYLIGFIRQSSSFIIKLIGIFMFLVLFRDPTMHTQYDCGRL